MLLRSPIDNDSRVKKEINSLRKEGVDITLLSVNGSKLDGVKNHVHEFESKRRLIPGVSGILAFFTFLFFSLRYFNKHDVIHAHDLNALPIAAIIKLVNFFKRPKIVYDSHELAINDVPNETYFSSKRKYLLERLFIRFADEVITVSPMIAERYSELYRINLPSVVHNCPNYQQVKKQNIFREFFDIPEDNIIFLYQGALCSGRGIEDILNTFTSLDGNDKSLVFMGYGGLEGLIKSYQAKHDNIHFHPAVAQNVLLDYTSSADFGIALIEDTCESYRLCMPNKIFEYLMAGLPIIVSNLVEMKRLVNKYDVGVVAHSNNASDVVSAMLKASELDKTILENNVKRVSLDFNWEVEAEKLCSIYKRLN